MDRPIAMSWKMSATSCSSAPGCARRRASPMIGSPSIPASASARASRRTLALIEGSGRLAAAGYPVLVGSSRKGFIGRLTGIAEPPAARSGVGLARGRGGAARRRHPARARRGRHPPGPRGSGRRCGSIGPMARSLFGTDGVRGRANTAPMTAEIAMRIGMAAGTVFKPGATIAIAPWWARTRGCPVT